MSDRTIPHLGSFRPPIALGSLAFGDGAESDAVLDAYRAAGGRLLDLALVYGDGVAERIVGEWLHAARLPRRDGAAGEGCAPAALRSRPRGRRGRALARAARRRPARLLRAAPRPPRPAGEAWADALLAEVEAGTITTFGVSNWTTARTLELHRHLRGAGSDRSSSSSNHLSLARMARRRGTAASRSTPPVSRAARRGRSSCCRGRRLAGGFFAGRDARNELVRRPGRRRTTRAAASAPASSAPGAGWTR